MNRTVSKWWQVRSAPALLIAAAALTASGMSRAGCVDNRWTSPAAKGGAFHHSAYRFDDRSLGSFIKVNDGWEEDSIVGLWKFEMIAKSTPKHKNPMPDGILADFGTAAWHQDGTELQISGFHNPVDANSCQGAWKRVGKDTYELNHYALAWSNGAYTGPVNIRASVVVSPSGKHYWGNFVTIVYLASMTPGHEFDQNTVLATITGTISGTRIYAD